MTGIFEMASGGSRGSNPDAENLHKSRAKAVTATDTVRGDTPWLPCSTNVSIVESDAIFDSGSRGARKETIIRV
jgi:hypothetical protein